MILAKERAESLLFNSLFGQKFHFLGIVHFMVPGIVFFIGIFTLLIHMTESLAYSMRLAGVRTKKIATALSFVTTTLLISRFSNLFQAPLLGAMVDMAILHPSANAVMQLESSFRIILLFAFLGSLIGAFLTPTMVNIFISAIQQFSIYGSVPKLFLNALKPRSIIHFFKAFKRPTISMRHRISLTPLPKGFLILNLVMTSIYAIGVLCSLLAGAMMPEFRSTALQLSGIVNGMATILMTLFVDPSGARITDQAINQERPEEDVRSTVFFLQLGKIIGTLILAQLLLHPMAKYILWVTKCISKGVSW